MVKAKFLDINHPSHHKDLAQIILKGGVVGSLWGHHLYFLTCNAYDKQAVSRLNKIKGRPANQVLVSPGSIEEIEEFADIKRSEALINTSKLFKMTPIDYLKFLLKKFPLGIEFIAKVHTPGSISKSDEKGVKTIWLAGYLKDKYYCNLLDEVRSLRNKGHKIAFAGSSLNLKGENTLTIKDLDQVILEFGELVEALSVHPNSKKLKRLRFTTSCSAVSFIDEKPRLLRVGCTKISTLRKYIPNLVVPLNLASTRK